MLVIVMAVGALFRLLNLATVRHGYDQSYPMYDALRMLDGGELLLIGQPSSVFLDNPVLMSYIQALPLALWRSPWSAYLFITFLNWLAIWFVYRLGRRFWDERVGLVAALLFAVNPWVVFFSGLTWVQGLLPLGTAVVAWGLWPVLAGGQSPRPSARVLLAGLATVMMVQTYIQALGILLPLLLLLLLFRRRVPARALYISGALLTVGFLIYGVGLSDRWEANRQKLAGFSGDSEIRLTREGYDHSMRLVTGRDYEGARAQPEPSGVRRALSDAAHYLLAAAIVSGVVHALLALRQNGRQRRIAAILLIWWGLPMALTTVAPYKVHPHYLLLGLPAGHMLAAWGVSPLMEARGRRMATSLVLALIAALFLVNVYQAGRAVSENAMWSAFDGWGLFAGQRLGNHVRQLTAPPAAGQAIYPRRVYAQGEDAILSSLSGTYMRSMTELDYPSYVILPGEEPLLYVLFGESYVPAALGPRQETFPEREMVAADGTVVSFVRAAPYSREAALALPEVVVDWPNDSGLTLLGYSLEGDTTAGPGDIIAGTVYWRVEGLPPDRNERYVASFRQLLNDQHQIVANIPGAGQWGYQWQAGDVHVERFQIQVPPDTTPGAYQVALGLSDPVHQTSFSFQAPGGQEPVFTIPVTVR